jgi:hypothetical protein
MTQTPISPGLVSRITGAARYVISGVAPDAWFGPLQPLAPIAPPSVAGRRFDYPTGYNLSYTPRVSDPVSFEELRALADCCDIVRSVIETRKDQIEAQEWTVRVAASDTSARIPVPSDDQKRRIDAVLAFLHSPDREHGFDQWLRQILEDMFVIDGVAIYKRRNRAGGLYALEVIDAGTIKLLLDDSGRLPVPPDPAYQQILKGVPAADYTREELMYLIHNPRSHRVYGYGHVEQILVTVNILIRRALHQLEYYRDGSIPDAFVGVPKEWNQDQIADFQKHFDAMLSGNLATRRRVRFMSGDFKYQETKAPPLKDAYDEFLARIVCFVFSISPEPFVGQVNRATAETSHARAADEGLAPLMRFVRSFMNRLIAAEFASPDLEFVWQDAREQDPAQAAQIDVAYVGAGILTVDEVRANMGLAPVAGIIKPPAPMPPAKKLKKRSRKYNPNHLGPGPGGGQFTTAALDGTSNGLPPGSGHPARSSLTPPSRAGAQGTMVAQEVLIDGLGNIGAAIAEEGAAVAADTAAASKPTRVQPLPASAPEEAPLPTTEDIKPTSTVDPAGEISRIVDKAIQTTGNNGDIVSDKNIAEEAAKQFVGDDSEAIYDRQSGNQVGEVSADGLRVARYTSADEPNDPYINLENKPTSGNLHLRWLK